MGRDRRRMGAGGRGIDAVREEPSSRKIHWYTRWRATAGNQHSDESLEPRRLTTNPSPNVRSANSLLPRSASNLFLPSSNARTALVSFSSIACVCPKSVHTAASPPARSVCPPPSESWDACAAAVPEERVASRRRAASVRDPPVERMWRACLRECWPLTWGFSWAESSGNSISLLSPFTTLAQTHQTHNLPATDTHLRPPSSHSRQTTAPVPRRSCRG